jgi:methionyl-tRNA formyltransferase
MPTTKPWRVVILSNDGFSVSLLHRIIQECGHSTIAAIMPRPKDLERHRRSALGVAIAEAPADLEVCVVTRSSRLAPVLQPYAPDLAVCMYFPWLVPADALAVPRLGVINGHPSLLPRHRGPMPMAWAIRNGDREIGVTVHRMDGDFDTGPMLAQAGMEISADAPFGEVNAALQRCAIHAFIRGLAQLAKGSAGDPQPEAGASYAGPFTAEDAWLDLSRPAREVNNLVRAWGFVGKHKGERGPLVEVEGEIIRIHITSLMEPPAPVRRLDCADGPLWVSYEERVSDLARSSGSPNFIPAA